MHRKFVARGFAHPSISVILLVALLLLSGCGGSSQPEAEAAILPTATLVPTFLPPTATPIPAEPTATPEPVATEAMPEVTATEEITATGEITGSDKITATEGVTPTADVTTTQAITATEETTPTAAITGTITASDEITATEGVTTSASVTTSTGVTVTQAFPANNEVSPTEAITATEGVTATDTVTGARPLIDISEDGVTSGIIASPEITGSSEITGVAEITPATEISASSAISDARVYFLHPTTNAIVPLTFTVVMSYTGVTLAPVAEGVADAGHMHILIDSDFIPAGEAIPNDALHHHFGDGSTSTELSLPPGSHILRLQYADNDHIALAGDQFRHEITVNVVEGASEQSVRIASPTAGATVPTTFTVVMAASGLKVEPAGFVNENAGHFHLLIDEPYVAAGQIIPTNDTHLHFGKAQLTTTVTLEPGNYLLRLQLADGNHRALSGNQFRAEVAVIVEEGAPAEQVMFVKPADDATVTSPFLVGWAASGLIIEAAGSSIRPQAGHLHLLINEEFIAAGEAIPTDETHLHFGRGQTNTELTLEPGEYTLRLQMANGAHIAHKGAHYRDEITVTVK